ncbi:hypothetical protein ILUMI_15117 [Ignelater luminosus]|uniref:Uncharacterized protein n=1 Tax=Ignelater luminosus TaxID=2038154 RepID=A0A8K0CTP1_IGNLU|nr:hypothetical protein ILUMI_15117 [Ignelater luminosus]
MESRNNKRKINTLDSFIFKKKIINDTNSDLASVAVTEPEASGSQNYKNTNTSDTCHESTDYHTFSVTNFQDIELIEEKKQDPLHYQLDLASKHRTEENRKIISPTIDTIIICGRQCISLRGHRDSGPIDSEMTEILKRY